MITEDAKLTAAINALQRLSRREEMAGMGDVEDAEGLLRIEYARRVLERLGYSHKQRAVTGPVAGDVSAVRAELLQETSGG